MRNYSLFRRSLRTLGGWSGSSDTKARARRSAARRRLGLDRLEDRVLLHGGSAADSLAVYLPPRHDMIQRGGFLSAATPGDPRQVALSYLAGHASDLGLTPADVSQAL